MLRVQAAAMPTIPAADAVRCPIVAGVVDYITLCNCARVRIVVQLTLDSIDGKARRIPLLGSSACVKPTSIVLNLDHRKAFVDAELLLAGLSAH
jgi:hypothetical protein